LKGMLYIASHVAAKIPADPDPAMSTSILGIFAESCGTKF
jgi:hypothetical protein